MTAHHLDPFTLLKSEDGQVLSVRHRVLSGPSKNVSWEEAARAISERVQAGEWVIADGAAPSIPTCLECGCTEEFACPGGCSWTAENLCSSCGTPAFRSREAIAADAATAFDLAEHGQINEALARFMRVQTEVLLDMRDLLAGPVQSAEETRLDILERIAERTESRLVIAGAIPRP